MKIAIIGGSGKMGQWMARFLAAEGNQVIITGRNQQKLRDASLELEVETASNTEATRQADVVIISVPINGFKAVVAELSPYTHPRQVIVDVTSVKAFPVDVMHRYIPNGRILGIHPVFGPGASSAANHNFVLTPTNEKENILAQKVKGYLKNRGGRVTVMSPEEHDRMMTVILGLSHFIALVAGDTLLSMDKVKNIETFGGISYKVLLTLVESVILEDPELYASLQMHLPDMATTEQLFQRKAQEWADLVQHRDNEQFVDRMRTLRHRLEEDQPDLGKAYSNMYRIVEGL